MMTLNDLIARLTELQDELGPDTEVRLATQPHYPLQYQIAGVTAFDPDAESIRELKQEVLSEKMACEYADMGLIQEHEAEIARLEREKKPPLVYILEGSSVYDDPYCSTELWEGM